MLTYATFVYAIIYIYILTRIGEKGGDVTHCGHCGGGGNLITSIEEM